MNPPASLQWQMAWGTPIDLVGTTHRYYLDAAFIVALAVHLSLFGVIWRDQLQKKHLHQVTAMLQNVDLIEPESEVVAPPPPPVVQKPKSALDFIKMALPVFRTPPPVEAPRDIVVAPKIAEPKIAEPEKLIERRMAAPTAAPEIRLDARKPIEAPKIMDAQLPTARPSEPQSAEPALKLEEVGRRAVAPQIQAPAISMDRAPRGAADMSALPRIARAVPSDAPTDRLVDRGVAPSAPQAPAPLSYRTPGPSVSLDQPRDIVRAAPKQVVADPGAALVKKENTAELKISKDKVKIIGPLANRKRMSAPVPQYPDWARAQGIEADVAIRFTVSADGDVLDTVIERTSGYPDLDTVAVNALKQWKFSALSDGTGVQASVITFRFVTGD